MSEAASLATIIVGAVAFFGAVAATVRRIVRYFNRLERMMSQVLNLHRRVERLEFAMFGIDLRDYRDDDTFDANRE